MYLVRCTNLKVKQQLNLPDEMALKKIKLGSKTIDKTKVLKEAKYLKSLCHQNIIKFYHSFLEQSNSS